MLSARNSRKRKKTLVFLLCTKPEERRKPTPSTFILCADFHRGFLPCAVFLLCADSHRGFLLCGFPSQIPSLHKFSTQIPSMRRFVTPSLHCFRVLITIETSHCVISAIRTLIDNPFEATESSRVDLRGSNNKWAIQRLKRVIFFLQIQ